MSDEREARGRLNHLRQWRPGDSRMNAGGNCAMGNPDPINAWQPAKRRSMSEGDQVVTVHVSTELLAELREWSQPVEAQIVDGGPDMHPRYTMNFRTHSCAADREVTAVPDNG